MKIISKKLFGEIAVCPNDFLLKKVNEYKEKCVKKSNYAGDVLQARPLDDFLYVF